MYEIRKEDNVYERKSGSRRGSIKGSCTYILFYDDSFLGFLMHFASLISFYIFLTYLPFLRKSFKVLLLRSMFTNLFI